MERNDSQYNKKNEHVAEMRMLRWPWMKRETRKDQRRNQDEDEELWKRSPTGCRRLTAIKN